MRKLCTLRQACSLVCMGLLSLLFSTLLSTKTFANHYIPEEEVWFGTFTVPDTTITVMDGSCSIELALDDPGVPSGPCGTILSITNNVTSSDSITGLFPADTIMIVYWEYIYEAASMCNIDTVIQKIIIQDGVPPTIAVIDDITTDCDIDDVPPFLDFSTYVAAGGSATDNCALDFASWELVDEESDNGFNPEIITRMYRLADQSGNYDTITHRVIVEDETDPNISCVSDDIGISYGDPEWVANTSFYTSASDNCGGPVSVQIARMDENIFRDSVAFTCADVGTNVMVILEVKDISGNTNTCMVEAEISDNLPPIVMQHLPDIEVSCSFPLDVNDLSPFGGWDINAITPTPIIINDPELDPSGPVTVGNNGMVQENCPDVLDIQENIDDQRICGTGNIIRNFTITDQFDNQVTSQQVITVVDPSPFTENDIKWPERYMFDNCADFTRDTAITGSPILNITDNCSQPMVTYNDFLYDEPNSGCIVVERVWKVIDWCTYDKESNIGIWNHTQYIKVLNNVAPELVDQTDTLEICAPGSACSGTIDFHNTATDDCTDSLDIIISYAYDIDNDGSIDGSGDGRNFALDLDQGTHRIIWYASDQCGNVGEQVQIVVIKECKLPTPVCLHGVSVSLSQTGIAEIWASDFNRKSSDNCTAEEDLIFSFSPDTSDQALFLNCDSVGILDIEMWVTDEEGNQSFCVTYLDVQDNHEVCPGSNVTEGNEEPTEAMITGRVYTPYETPIPDAQINISGPEYETYKMTDNDGKYSFEDLRMHNQYEVVALKDDNPLSGVTTLDLVKIQRHIMGLEKLDSPYALIAADIDNSQHVSAIDIIQLRKLILGIYDHFPENNSWRFVETQFGIVESDYPWPFVEGIFVNDLDKSMVEGNFIGVKVGDVDYSVEEKLTRRSLQARSKEQLLISIADDYLQSGEEKEISIKVGNQTDLIGLQWTLSFDDTKMQLVDWSAGNLNVEEDNIAIINGEGQHLSLAWTSLEGTYLSAGETIIKVKVKALQDIQLRETLHLGSTITEAAAYNTNDERITLDMMWENTTIEGLALHQNTPNPFNDHTNITFHLPKDMSVELIVTDISGKIAHQQRGYYNAGKNTVRITAEEMNIKPGVAYYTLRTNTQSITKKMIFLR